MPRDSVPTTSKGWPYIDPELYFRAFPAYTQQLATKLDNADADVAAAINAATRAETAAATAVAAAGRFDAGWVSVPVSAGTGTLVVPFKAGRFTSSPNVIYSPNTGATLPAGTTWQTSAVSAAQCTLKVTAPGYTGNIGFSWFAVQL